MRVWSDSQSERGAVTVVVNTREDFSLENFRRVSREGEDVQVGDEARRVMDDARRDFIALLESDRTQFIYGVTSKYGRNSNVPVPPEQQRARARQPRGRGIGGRGFGREALSEDVVRGMLFARLVNFVTGHAKVRPVLAERVAALLSGPLPRVPLDGQVSAGEVIPLSHALRDLDRSDLEEGEPNAVVNGAPVSAALVADVALDLPQRLRTAAAVFALAVEAYRAPLGAYDAALDSLWGDPAHARALELLREFLAGADVERIGHQAPVSYRIIARVLGEACRASSLVEDTAVISLRAVTENPVYVLPDSEHPLGRVFSTGGFHNGAAAFALNAANATLADLVLLSERLATALSWWDVSGLPGEARLGLSWVLGGYVEEARAAALPSLLPAALNDAQDDISSPVFPAYRRTLRASECLDHALAGLAAEASQALFVTGRKVAPPLIGFLEGVRAIFPPVEGLPSRELGSEVERLADAFAATVHGGSLELVP